MMRISVIGSGAMGCLFGSLLSVKNDVVIIGRNKNTVDFINNHGITINSSEKFYPKAALNGSFYEKSDLAVIMVKAYDTAKALENNKKLIENSQYILTLQNGLEMLKIFLNLLKEIKFLSALLNITVLLKKQDISVMAETVQLLSADFPVQLKKLLMFFLNAAYLLKQAMMYLG